MRLIVFLICTGKCIAEIIDPSCTFYGDDGLVFSNQSTSCKNVYSNTACSTLFPGKEVVEGKSDERPLSCFTTVNPQGTEVVTDIRRVAITSCPQRCGYCCLTNDYNCLNSEVPRVDCDIVTKEMCQNAHWFDILSQDCPKTCGLCSTERCKDEIDNCNSVMCITIGMELFVKENCRRTCAYCDMESVKLQCFDTNSNCGEWLKNGFCSNSHYSEAQKRRHCEKTCHLFSKKALDMFIQLIVHRNCGAARESRFRRFLCSYGFILKTLIVLNKACLITTVCQLYLRKLQIPSFLFRLETIDISSGGLMKFVSVLIQA
ncbi:unnamed protein product [Auanema sp. JU1783]|nr:unnamed protein product [Auanema sp. JU1783]